MCNVRERIVGTRAFYRTCPATILPCPLPPARMTAQRCAPSRAPSSCNRGPARRRRSRARGCAGRRRPDRTRQCRRAGAGAQRRRDGHPQGCRDRHRPLERDCARKSPSADPVRPSRRRARLARSRRRAPPDFAHAHNNRGIALVRLKRHDDAVAHRACARVAAVYPGTALNLGEVANQAGDSAQARSAYARAREGSASRSRGAGVAFADALEGRLDEACSALESAVRDAPALAAAWQTLGAVRNWSWRHDEAEIAYRRACELDPANREAQFGIASTLLARGRYAEGIRSVRGFTRPGRSLGAEDTHAPRLERRAAVGHAGRARRARTGRRHPIRALSAPVAGAGCACRIPTGCLLDASRTLAGAARGCRSRGHRHEGPARRSAACALLGAFVRAPRRG